MDGIQHLVPIRSRIPVARQEEARRRCPKGPLGIVEGFRRTGGPGNATHRLPYVGFHPLGACAVEVLMLGDWRAAAGEVGFWPECGHLAHPTLGCKSQSGRPKRKRFAFHTRSMGTARPGASALAGQHLPQHVATVPIRLMFNAKYSRIVPIRHQAKRSRWQAMRHRSVFSPRSSNRTWPPSTIRSDGAFNAKYAGIESCQSGIRRSRLTWEMRAKMSVAKTPISLSRPAQTS